MTKKQKKEEEARLDARLSHFGAVIEALVTAQGPVKETEPVQLPKVQGTTTLLAIANHIASTTPEEIPVAVRTDGTTVPSRSPKTGAPMGFAVLNAAVRRVPTLGKVETTGGSDAVYLKGNPPKDASWDAVNARRADVLGAAGF